MDPHALIDRSSSGDGSILIKVFFEEMSGGHVEKDIGRSSVEGEDAWFFAATPIEGSDVTDAAEIVDGDVLAFTGEDVPMEDGGEGRSLSAGGDIRRAKV